MMTRQIMDTLLADAVGGPLFSERYVLEGKSSNHNLTEGTKDAMILAVLLPYLWPAITGKVQQLPAWTSEQVILLDTKIQRDVVK